MHLRLKEFKDTVEIKKAWSNEEERKEDYEIHY